MTIETDIATVAKVLSDAAPVVEQIVSVMYPGAGAAAAVAVKIAQGVAAGIPEAIALYDQFKAGTIPTQAQLDAYAAAEDSSYSKLMADIATAEKAAS